MGRRIRRQPTASLLELALAADPVAASCLIPRNGDVHETLEEVALGGLRGAPGLERADQTDLDALFVLVEESVTLATWPRSC